MTSATNDPLRGAQLELAAALPPALVFMGVAGSGKSTVAGLLASAVGSEFLDAQWLHTAEGRDRLTRGIALTDADREPWLVAVRDRIRLAIDAEQPIIVACSALKRRYRDRLREAGPVVFVHLVGERWQIVDRLGPLTQQRLLAPLLESQFAALEPLEADESGFAVSIAAPAREVATTVAGRLMATDHDRAVTPAQDGASV